MTEKRLGVPDHVPEGEEREDGLPLLFPVIEDFGPHAKTLFLGKSRLLPQQLRQKTRMKLHTHRLQRSPITTNHP